jgi:metal-dependent amidase/aminoacylase/carboxypeptidase family protein
VAKYRRNNGSPTLGVIVEYDALRGTKGAFHGDQHSAQGPVGLAAAIAMSEYLTRTNSPGSVIVYGTPGEEMMPPNAKTVMHEAHVFDGADVIVRSHAVNATTRPAHGFGSCCLNIVGAKYTFSGAPTHQMTPWNGRNALTAMNLFFGNIDAVRPSIRPEARIQGYILEGGTAPNVVPDRSVADFYIRYPDEVYLKQVVEFVDNAANAAALATGTKVKIDHYGKALDGIGLATLAETGFAYMKKFGATGVSPEPAKPQGYEETGSVSRDIPGIGITAQSSTFSNHTYEMDADNLKEIGHNGFIVDAQTMAAVLFDFAREPTTDRGEEGIRRDQGAVRRVSGSAEESLHRADGPRPEVNEHRTLSTQSAQRHSNFAGFAGFAFNVRLARFCPRPADARSRHALGVGVAQRADRDGLAQLVVVGARAARCRLERGRCVGPPGIVCSPAK